MSTFTDDFNRADAGSLGANWVEWTSGHIISGNKALPESNAACASFSATDLDSDDHYAEYTLTGNPPASPFFGPIVRAANIGTSATNTGAYYVLMVSGASANAVSIRRKAASSSTVTLIASGTQAVVGGDVLRLEAEGSTIRAKVNGVVVCSVTDTVVPAGQRRVGIYSDMPNSGPGTLGYDNFSAADLGGGTPQSTSAARVTLTCTALAVTAAAGPVSVALPRVTATATARAVTATPGAASAGAPSLQLTATARPVTGEAAPPPGTTAARVTVTATARPVTASAGPAAVPLPRPTLTTTARAVTATPGTATRSLPRLALTLTARAVTAAAGAVTRALPRLTLTGTARPVVASTGPPPQTTSLARLVVTATPRAVTATPGTATRGLARQLVSLTARPPTAVGSGTAAATLSRVTATTVARAVDATPGTAIAALERLGIITTAWPVVGVDPFAGQDITVTAAGPSTEQHHAALRSSVQGSTLRARPYSGRLRS